jgi:SET domain
MLPTAILIFRLVMLGVRAVDEMQSHDAVPLLSEEGAFHQKAVAALVQQLCLVACPTKLPSPERINFVHNVIKYNSFSIVGNDGEALGIGLYQGPAYRINHSCIPNARQSFTGTTLHVYATRDIACGEEVCISYCDANDTMERKQFLQNEYCFVCRCPLCSH